MKFREHRVYRLAVQVAAVLLACIGLRSAIYHAQRAPALNPQAAYDDWVAANERRFQSVRTILPPLRRIGYMTDVPPAQLLANGQHQAPWYAAQYVLAPMLVVNSLDEEYVLANFDNVDNSRNIDARRFAVLLDSGNGVMLLKKVQP